jgi:hypothetical protein
VIYFSYILKEVKMSGQKVYISQVFENVKTQIAAAANQADGYFKSVLINEATYVQQLEAALRNIQPSAITQARLNTLVSLSSLLNIKVTAAGEDSFIEDMPKPTEVVPVATEEDKDNHPKYMQTNAIPEMTDTNGGLMNTLNTPISEDQGYKQKPIPNRMMAKDRTLESHPTMLKTMLRIDDDYTAQTPDLEGTIIKNQAMAAEVVKANAFQVENSDAPAIQSLGM